MGAFPVRLGLIAALGPRGEIGRDGRLVYQSQEDMEHFVRYTKAIGAVLVGRKTWESIPVQKRPLTDRHTFILTSQSGYDVGTTQDRVTVCRSMEQFASEAMRRNCQSISVIGGAQVYATALPYVREIAISRFREQVEADTFWPKDAGMKGFRITSTTAFRDFDLQFYHRSDE